MSEKAVFEPIFKRVTEKEEENCVKNIWQEIFGDDREFIDRFYDAFPMKENTFVAKDGEKVVAIVNAIDCRLLYENELFCGKYIYALAVEKAYRGRGIARGLLEISESGSFVLLVPETPELFAMYDRLGYNEKADVDERFVDPCLFLTDGKGNKKVSALVKIKDNKLESFEEKMANFFIQG